MRPNFLIFITDQHRADHLGFNPIVRTPNIDALARGGVCFDRAYVATPVCMPNRGSIMTSRMPSIHGARSNGVPLPLEAVTFADLLGEFGYRTALVGKSHLQNMEDAPPLLKTPESRAGTQKSRPGVLPGAEGELGRSGSPPDLAVLRFPGGRPLQQPRRRVLR